MKEKTIKNIPVSVRQRLSNIARSENRIALDLLHYYAMERFLYRLSKSSHADSFILKGALLLHVFGGELSRATKDIDFLAKIENSEGSLANSLKEIMQIPSESDGIQFHPDTLSISKTQWDSRDRGMRADFLATLGTSKISMRVDLAFGSQITPAPIQIIYPEILDMGSPRIFGSTLESVIADKFEAMVSRDETNSRLKDFYDLWVISKNRAFEFAVLSDAIKETFAFYGTSIPNTVPLCFHEKFYALPEKIVQWKNFFRQSKLKQETGLKEVCERIEMFLLPICQHVLSKTESPKMQWNHQQGWVEQL